MPLFKSIIDAVAVVGYEGDSGFSRSQMSEILTYFAMKHTALNLEARGNSEGWKFLGEGFAWMASHLPFNSDAKYPNIVLRYTNYDRQQGKPAYWEEYILDLTEPNKADRILFLQGTMPQTFSEQRPFQAKAYTIPLPSSMANGKAKILWMPIGREEADQAFNAVDIIQKFHDNVAAIDDGTGHYKDLTDFLTNAQARIQRSQSVSSLQTIEVNARRPEPFRALDFATSLNSPKSDRDDSPDQAASDASDRAAAPEDKSKGSGGDHGR